MRGEACNIKRAKHDKMLKKSNMEVSKVGGLRCKERALPKKRDMMECWRNQRECPRNEEMNFRSIHF